MDIFLPLLLAIGQIFNYAPYATDYVSSSCGGDCALVATIHMLEQTYRYQFDDPDNPINLDEKYMAQVYSEMCNEGFDISTLLHHAREEGIPDENTGELYFIRELVYVDVISHDQVCQVGAVTGGMVINQFGIDYGHSLSLVGCLDDGETYLVNANFGTYAPILHQTDNRWTSPLAYTVVWK